jgi:hypothetical protein
MGEIALPRIALPRARSVLKSELRVLAPAVL